MVMEDENEDVIVSAVNPQEMFKIVDNPGIKETVLEVKEKLARAIDSL